MVVETIRPIEIAIEPKAAADRDRLLGALSNLTSVDPEHAFHIDTESGQIILDGMSELGLDRLIGQILDRVPILIGNPRVAYRETIAKSATADHTHKKPGSHEFARIKIEVRPDAPGWTVTVENDLSIGVLPTEFAAAVLKGIDAVIKTGSLIGFPIVQARVRVIDATDREGHSSASAFESAARTAMRDALVKAEPKLLEPVMVVEVMTPAECLSTVTRDLTSRRAHFLPGDPSTPLHRISAHVPLDHMFGYDSSLRGITSGRGTWSMSFSHYAPVPPTNRGPDTFGPAVGLRG